MSRRPPRFYPAWSSVAVFDPANPDFSAVLADAGSGAVDLTLAKGSGSATFSRATSAAAKLSTGLWKLDVASGVARSHYVGGDTTVGGYAGYIGEISATNLCLWSRDLTDAAWVKTNVLATKDATGIDGAVEASTLIAVGANGTALQSITAANAARGFSVFVRRKIGTGDIFITLDGDSTRTDITALINGTTYTRVFAGQGLANPVVGFKIATSGDSIEVDCCQLESGSVSFTSPVVTTSASATRNTDSLSYDAANAVATQGACYAELHLTNAITTARSFVELSSPGTGMLLGVQNGAAVTTISMDDGPTVVSKTGLTSLQTGSRKRASAWGGTTMSITGDGAASASGTFDGAMNTGTVDICDTALTGQSMCAQNVKIWKTKPTDAQLEALTA